MPRQLLFVTYYFPPSGGPGVQRALKFAKYLPSFGWRPTVLTVRPEDAAYPNLDASLAEEVPAAIRVERTRAWDPYALYARMLGKEKGEAVGVGFVGESEANWKQKLARWIRANLFLPDARVGWVPFAVRRGRALLEAAPHEAILTTGPPHSTHLIGRLLAHRSGLPWIADFRDPWTDIDYAHMLPTSALAQKVDGALERSVLQHASIVTVVSPSWRRDLERRVEATYEVIWNGFDPADFSAASTELPSAFLITYVGNMNAARNPQALWRALQALDAATRMPRLRVRLIGNIDPAALDSARQHGLAGLVEVVPYVPHAEAVRHMEQSALLLLMINQVPNRMGVVTGKVYEYIASGRPILGIGPPGGDAAAVLEATGAGRMFDYEAAAAIAAFVQQHYTAWVAGRPQAGADADAAASFSRKSQTGRLAALLDRLVEEETARLTTPRV